MFSLKYFMSPRISDGLAIVSRLMSHNKQSWYQTSITGLVDVIGDLRLCDVTPDHIREYSDIIDRRDLSAHTKNTYRRAVRAFFNHMVAVGHIDEDNNPVKGFRIAAPPPLPPKHLQPDEIARLLSHATGDPRNHALMLMLHETGARISDLASMRMSNLVIQRRHDYSHLAPDVVEFVKRAYDAGLEHLVAESARLPMEGKALVLGKGRHGAKKPRWIFFGQAAAAALMKYIDTRPANAPDDVWLSSVGQPITPQAIYAVFKRIAARAGVDASPHDMRHSFAYRLIRNGADPRMVQSLLGHSDLSTTMTQYYGFSDDELWDVHRQFVKR